MTGILAARYSYRKWHRRVAALLFDGISALVMLPWRLSGQRKVRSAGVRRILLVRIDQIGDNALVRPCIPALRKLFPAAALDVLTSSESSFLYEHDPQIRDVIVFSANWFAPGRSISERLREAASVLVELRRRQYDMAFDFRGDLRTIMMLFLARIPVRAGYGLTGGRFFLTHCGTFDPALHQVSLNMRLLEFFGMPGEAENRPVLSGGRNASALLAEKGVDAGELPRPWFIFHFEAGKPEKSWAREKIERFLKEILSMFTGTFFFIGVKKGYVIPSAGPAGHVSVDLRAQTRAADLPVLLSACDLFTGLDSGPGHLAAAQGLRVVSIFQGPNRPGGWHPWTRRLHLVEHPRPCPACGSNRCPLQDLACLDTLSWASVYDAFQDAVKLVESDRPETSL